MIESVQSIFRNDESGDFDNTSPYDLIYSDVQSKVSELLMDGAYANEFINKFKESNFEIMSKDFQISSNEFIRRF